MANDYRILDERDIKNFQAGNKLEVTEIGNKVTYEHIGEPPNTLPSKEKVLEYGESFNITVPSVYDSTGHVKSETKYSFIMPQETNTSNFLTTDNFLSESPISVNKSGKNVTYSHNTSSIDNTTTTIGPNVNNTISLTALSAADDYGHATEKTTYQFQIPNISNFLTTNNFSSEYPIHIKKDGKNVTYSHDTSGIKSTPTEEEITPDNNIISLTVLSEADAYGHATKNTKYKFKIPEAVDVSNVPTTGNFLSVSPIRVGTSGKNVTYSHDESSIDKDNPTTTTITPDNNIISLVALSAADDYGHATTNTKYQFTVPSMPSKIELAGGVTGEVSDLNSKTTWKLNTEVDYYHNYMEESHEMTGNDSNFKTYVTQNEIDKTHFLYIVLTPREDWWTESGSTTSYMIPGQLTFMIPTTNMSSSYKKFQIPVLTRTTEDLDISITIDGKTGSTTIKQEKIHSVLGYVQFRYQSSTELLRSTITIESNYSFKNVDIFGF